MEDAGLPRAGAPHQRHVFAGADDERDAVQDRLVVSVSEHDVLEIDRSDLTSAVPVPCSAPAVIGREGQRREDPLGASHRSLDRLPLFAERGDRLEEALEKNQERGQRPDGDAKRAGRLLRPGGKEERDGSAVAGVYSDP